MTAWEDCGGNYVHCQCYFLPLFVVIIGGVIRYADHGGAGTATKHLKRQMEAELEELRKLSAPDEWEALERVATHLICRLEGHICPVTDTKFSNCGDRVLTGSMKDGTVRIWSFSKDYQRHEHILIALHTDDDEMNIPDFARRRGRGSRLRENKTFMYNVAWTCDDQRVVTVQNVPLVATCSLLSLQAPANTHMPTRLKVWDSMTGSLLFLLNEVCSKRCPVLVTHPIAPAICVTAGDDGILSVWDIETGRNLASHSLTAPYDIPGLDGGTPTEIVDANFSPDGTRIIVTDYIGRVTLIGCDNPARYQDVKSEQYFSTDYAEIVLDQEGYAMDANTQMPVHISPVGPLCQVCSLIMR